MKKRFDVRIYALTDLDNNVFYVGCTTKALKYRLCSHLSGCRAYDSWRNSLKDQKIRSLNFGVRIRELQLLKVKASSATNAQRIAEVTERRWIKAFRGLGIELCNTAFTDNKGVKGSNKNTGVKQANPKTRVHN